MPNVTSFKIALELACFDISLVYHVVYMAVFTVASET